MKTTEKDKISAYIIIGVLIIIFGVFMFKSAKDLISYIEIKNNGIRDEAIIADIKEKSGKYRTWS